jgi:hypothetical protein
LFSQKFCNDLLGRATIVGGMDSVSTYFHCPFLKCPPWRTWGPGTHLSGSLGHHKLQIFAVQWWDCTRYQLLVHMAAEHWQI